MANTKKRKTKKKKQGLENEVLVYIYSLLLITLSIIGGLRIGFIGEITTGFIQYIFGNLYGVIYGIIIVFCVLFMLKKSVQDIPMKYIVAVGVLMSAWLLAAAVPKDSGLKGMDIVSQYLADSVLIFKGEVASKGGLIGAFLVSVCTFLFDYMGTWIVIGAMVILGVILLLHGALSQYLANGFASMRKPFEEAKKSNAKRKAEKKQKSIEKKKQQEKSSEQETIFAPIDLEERIKPGQLSFVDLDDEFDGEKENESDEGKESNDDLIIGFDSSNKTNLQDAQNQQVIEATIGMEDTFVSAFTQDYSKYRLPKLTPVSYTHLDVYKRQQVEELERIAAMTTSEAKEELLAITEKRMDKELVSYIKEREEEAKAKADETARNIVALSIQRIASDESVDRTVSVVALPSEEMKGRIIGREGRNIKAIEQATGVDLIIDDTPETITVSCFDPIRREIARLALEQLIKDGRIQPGRIEEVVNKIKNEMEANIMKTGEDTVFKLGIGKIDREIIRLIGRLKYRFSYGQNRCV